MKKALLRSLTAGLLTVILLTGIMSSAQVVLNNNLRNGIVLQENSFTGIRANSTFAGFDHFEVNTPQGLFTEVSAADYTFTWEEGSPKLPVMRRLIEIPVGAEPVVTVVSYDVKEYSLSDLGIQHPIMPTQPGVAKSFKGKVDFVINNDVYTADKFNRNVLARVEVIGLMRNTRIARLEISPVE